jgi:hypothetical protein
MARYTSAYSSFVSRMAEVEILRCFAGTKEKSDPINMRSEINALCRGAVVLLCGHLEAYIRELGEVALNSIHSKAVSRNALALQFYYHISKDILDDLKDTNEPSKIANKLFDFLQSDYSLWGRTGPFPCPIPADRFNKGFSNPAFRKIVSYFNRFGYSDYKKDIAHLLQANYNATVNMVDHLVDTRNKIAHGDPAATKTPADVKNMVTLILVYCRATDITFASWCNRCLCCIR